MDDVAHVDGLTLAKDGHEHVMVGPLQRKVEVARHLVDEHVAVEVATLSHVRSQLGDGLLVLEDPRQQLGEQLAQQQIAPLERLPAAQLAEQQRPTPAQPAPLVSASQASAKTTAPTAAPVTRWPRES